MPKSNRSLAAREQALAAVSGLKVTAVPLVEYQSAGRVLVIGGEAAARFAAGLRPPLSARLVPFDAENRQLSLSGHLGDFRLHLDEGAGNLEVTADLVVDLTAEPLLSADLPPPGYFHLTETGEAAAEVLIRLEELIGRFDKPDYTRYDPDRCAHGRNGMTACRRCIDNCPAGAISGLAESVRIDPLLCQGDGICASVCPSGAIRYAFPPPGDLGNSIRLLLHAYREAGGFDPLLLFYRREQGLAPKLLQNRPSLLPVGVEELASVGPELWLAGLAWGARQVLLLDDPSMTGPVREALSMQLEMVGMILAALGYPAAVVLSSDIDAETAAERRMPTIEPARHAAMEEKRTALFMALDHLHDSSPKSKPFAALPVGAPFGHATVDPQRCTLCLACAGTCPTQALQAGQGSPQLRFIEANCIQCGLCTRTCPEDAIWITPRLLFDAERRRRSHVLHEDTPFCCVECGRPFATRAVIENMLSRLAVHPMFQTERERRRLRLCEECRIKDVVQDSDTMGKVLAPAVRKN